MTPPQLAPGDRVVLQGQIHFPAGASGTYLGPDYIGTSETVLVRFGDFAITVPLRLIEGHQQDDLTPLRHRMTAWTALAALMFGSVFLTWGWLMVAGPPQLDVLTRVAWFASVFIGLPAAVLASAGVLKAREKLERRSEAAREGPLIVRRHEP